MHVRILARHVTTTNVKITNSVLSIELQKILYAPIDESCSILARHVTITNSVILVELKTKVYAYINILISHVKITNSVLSIELQKIASQNTVCAY